jgi:Fic family protein
MLDSVKRYYRVGTVYTSNAIEGFSYTENETKILIENGLTAGGKPLRDALAVIGHAKAYDYMFDIMKKPHIKENDILLFHSFLEGSLDNSSVPGKYRDRNVHISGSDVTLPNWKEVPELIKKCFNSTMTNLTASILSLMRRAFIVIWSSFIPSETATAVWRGSP